MTFQKYEYHVMGAQTLSGLYEEMKARAAEGWRVISNYQEVKGGNVHVVVFERVYSPDNPPTPVRLDFSKPIMPPRAQCSQCGQRVKPEDTVCPKCGRVF